MTVACGQNSARKAVRAGCLRRGHRFRGPFVSGGPQFHRAGRCALFAPM